MTFKALEQQDALYKIRTEIEAARFVDKDTKLCKNANASGLEVAMQIIDKYKKESEDKAIKALEQEPVLDKIKAEVMSLTDGCTPELIRNVDVLEIIDKIRAEIEAARFVDKDTKLCKNANASGLEVALQIIDKYKAESEE